MTVIDSVSLYYCEGASDKEYHAQIKDAGSGHIVTFQYGRRGSALKPDIKTPKDAQGNPVPVEPAKARKIFEKLVAEETAKGYTTGDSGTPFTASETAGRVSGHLPQLLNPIDLDVLKALLNDAHYGFQEKHDGDRRMLARTGNATDGINRKGLNVALPQVIADAAQLIAVPNGASNDFVFDGELVGNKLYVFDLLEADGTDYRERPFIERYEALATILRANSDIPGIGSNIVLSLLYIGNGKQTALERAEAENWEGLVAKDLLAPYRPGRPNSGGTQLKYKRYATCTVEVSGVNEQRSVSMRLYDRDGTAHDVGNVTIPPNHSIPAVGALIEVRYLYAYRNGSIYQPTYLGQRSDLDLADCVLDQLQYKREPAA